MVLVMNVMQKQFNHSFILIPFIVSFRNNGLNLCCYLVSRDTIKKQMIKYDSKGKKVQLSLCLTKHHAMKTNWEE